jgi:hypothetical protein
LPVSEVAIFAGAVALIVGLINGGGPALIVGFTVCALGVIEITAREHFSGFRSHAMLLAAFPAIAVEIAIVVIVGGKQARVLALAGSIPVFGFTFLFLRKRWRAAHQARVARPARPRGR